MSDSDKAFAISYLANPRFHLSFTLPPSPSTNRTTPLRITYSDAGSTEPDAPVVLVCGGMLGGRWTAVGAAHVMGQEKGVRVLCVDRPGTGGSTRVPLQDRVAIWLETVPALLTHLSIPTVSLVSASAGCIYLLNTLLTHRRFLHPYTALLVPWVHPSHSSIPALTLATLLPVPAIASFHTLLGFVNQRLKPVTGFSGNLFKSVFRPVEPLPAIRNAGDPIGKEMLGVVLAQVMEYMFAEDTSGGSQDALLCLKKGGRGLWGGFEEYDDLVPRLARGEEERVMRERERDVGLEREPGGLVVDVFHAADDGMVGAKGQRYFDGCWRRERRGEGIEYRSRVVEGTDHENIGDVDKGAIGAIFDEVVRRWAREG